MKQDKDQTPKRNDFGLQRNLFIWPPSLYNLVVHGTLWNVRAVVHKVRTNNKFACFQVPVKQNRSRVPAGSKCWDKQVYPSHARLTQGECVERTVPTSDTKVSAFLKSIM